MSKVKKGVFLVSTAGVLTAILLGFQNCSKTQFTEATGGSVLKTEAAEEGSGNTSAGDDGSMADVPDSPNAANTPDSTSDVPDTQHPSQANNGGKKDRPEEDDSTSSEDEEDSVAAADIVECQMLHPNRKIVLGPEIEISSSNAASSRVCMSRSACLELVNAYANRHDCSLAAGAGQDPTEARQCTEIFPGSKGTCNHAKILADAEVTEILNILANK